MKKVWGGLLLFILGPCGFAQELTGSELLGKAIAFHDPNKLWKSFKAEFQVTMETPKSSDRHSTIFLDNRTSTFELEVSKDSDSYAYLLDKNGCNITLNGSATISETDKEKFRLSCERANMYRDYYTYLYGLPMKLKDEGTLVDEKVERKIFNGKTYLVLKVT